MLDFNVYKEESRDIVNVGILDFAKVIRNMLQNAVRVVSTLPTTESVVANFKEETSALPADAIARI